ncbi:MAG TPA: phasin family protein [Alcanivoracaceae bacterium]|nr:phasin family protein [Alcanivoracaceae bacterium]
MSDHKNKEQAEHVESHEKGQASQIPLDLRKYTQQIWLAGLGAFSRAEEEGGRFFDALVDTGKDLETKTRSAEAKVDELREKVRRHSGETMEKMEKAFDERLNKALSRLGLANKHEVDALKEQIEKLQAELDAKKAEKE